MMKGLLNKRVILTTTKSSKYLGVLVGVRRSYIFLSGLIILNKVGGYKAVSGNKKLNRRRFLISSIAEVVEYGNEE